MIGELHGRKVGVALYRCLYCIWISLNFRNIYCNLTVMLYLLTYFICQKTSWCRQVSSFHRPQRLLGRVELFVFARFSACWLLFVPKSEIPFEGASLWLDFRHPESRDKYIKHRCKRRLLQSHPEAVWLCKSVCTVRRDVCRKLNNKSVISFTQILFIMTVLKLSRHTV